MTTKLTTQGLKDLIIQVLEDYSLIMPYPGDERLMAEPVEHEPPPIMESRQDKIVSILQALNPKELDSLLMRFGYAKRTALSKSISKNILQNISNIKRAEKGDL